MGWFLRVTTAIVFGCAFLIPPLAGQSTGTELLQKMQSALGGADKIEAIRDLDWTVQADTFGRDGKLIGHVTKRTRWIRPNYLRLDQLGPGDTYMLYFDGVSGWEILPGRTKPVELAGGELEFAQKYLSGFMIATWTADRRSDCAVSSPGPNVIRISCGKSSDDIALDSHTCLPAEVLEWKRVQGILFPAHEKHGHPDTGFADMHLEKVAFDVGLKPSELAVRPKNGKPALDEK
jgi:hypothetical protein